MKVKIRGYTLYDLRMKKPRVGIMSGRLSDITGNKIQEFPEKTWETEFEKASKIGYSSIEWIYDNKSNPIFEQKGRRKMEFLSKEFSIQIESIICDYFMEKRLFGVSKNKIKENLEKLKNIISISDQMGIKILEIPLVDASSINTKEDSEEFRNNFSMIFEILDKGNVKIGLETDFPPQKFKDFLDDFDNNKIFANYDTGNSSSLGYNVDDEINILGEKIIHIHIKDRIFNGNTVPLGKGDTEFEIFFKNIAESKFSGEIIIQGARQNDLKSPVETCNEYLQFVNNFLNKYY